MIKSRPPIAQARLRAQTLGRVIQAFRTRTTLTFASPQGGLAAFSGTRRIFSLALLMIVALFISSIAAAFTAPAAGDFGYDVYDIVVNQILNGPIGFIGGLFLIVFGATQIMKNWVMTILCIIAGTVLIRAEALVVTLGALVG